MAILIEERNGAALVLRMNRPEAMNALSTALVRALGEGIAAGSAAPGVRAIVIAAAGGRAFSAGTDLKERATLDAAGKAAQSRSLLELALACDLRIAADDARFAFPEMTLGAYPGSGGPVTLSRVVGVARAKEILFGARRLDAAEALRLGLVERVAPRARLDEAALAWVAEMQATAPLALAALKRSLDEGIAMPFAEAAEHDQRLRRPLDATNDYAEGMRAHFEKRKPDFRGD